MSLEPEHPVQSGVRGDQIPDQPLHIDHASSEIFFRTTDSHQTGLGINAAAHDMRERHEDPEEPNFGGTHDVIHAETTDAALISEFKIRYPIPPRYREAPSLTPAEVDLSEHHDFLARLKRHEFSADNLDDVREMTAVVDTIFTALTGQQRSDYAHIEVLNPQEWESFKVDLERQYSENHPQEESEKIRQIYRHLGGVHINGIAVVGAREVENPKIIPVLLHEVGHGLFPYTNNRYNREFQADVFEVMGTQALSNYMNANGLQHEFSQLISGANPAYDTGRVAESANRYAGLYVELQKMRSRGEQIKIPEKIVHRLDQLGELLKPTNLA